MTGCTGTSARTSTSPRSFPSGSKPSGTASRSTGSILQRASKRVNPARLVAGVERRRSDRAPRGVDDLPRGERGGADVADLALRNEVGERGERLVDVGALFAPIPVVEKPAAKR